MGDTPPPDQPLPEWMTWSVVTNADGSEEYTIVTLPLTYYGPSIPLGTDGPWTDGGLTSPVDTPTGEAQEPSPTEDPSTITAAPEPEPTTVFITVTEDPTTVYITQPPPPPVTVTIVAPQPPAPAPSVTSGNGNPPSSIPNSNSSTSIPFPGITIITGSVSATTRSSSTTDSTSSTISAQPSGSSSGPSTTGTVTGGPLNPPVGTSSNSDTATEQSPSNTSPSTTTTPPSPPALESSLPSVTGSATTYLGLAPDAFLGVVLAIVLSVIILLCCILCWVRHRRRRRRRQQEALPPPTTEQASRLLAGDRDPTREDLAYPYSHQEREYRRSQIAMMRARGELDDDWEDRLHSPSMRSASVRLPEDEVGTAYGIRERAFAAAGVYGYTPVPRDASSFGAERDSVGDSTQVPTITQANVAVGAGSQSSPAPRKDTRSTEATASSALHLYAAGGRSRSDSNDPPDNNFFYDPTEEGEAPSPVASSADLHFLNRYSSQGAGGAAAIAAARAARRHAPSTGSASLDSNMDSPPEVPHTRNLEEVPRAAIAYPESPVSDDQESSRLMVGGEPPMTVMRDTAPQHQNHSSRESGLSRWIHGGDRSARASQQPPIFQRVLQRVMGNRLSTQPAFSIIPTSTQSHPQQYDQPLPPTDRMPPRISQDFDFGNGLLFPRPPMHTGHSSGANTARDDLRRWGGILPSRLSSGEGLPASGQGSRADVNALSQMEAGDRSTGRSLGAPIMANRDLMPQMKERAPTPGSNPLLGLGLRPPPPSAFPPDRGTSTYSSGRSTVYYDARSTTSTPMDTLGSGRDRAGSPLSRYDSPPPQPVTALRNAQSAQSLQSTSSAPFLPPGLFVASDENLDSEPADALDLPPPMPTRDVRQARSLNTIFSVGTAETYDTANPPLSIGRAFQQDEQARFPPPGLDPAPRISRSVPSDVGPSEAAEGDLGAGTFGSTGRASGTWRPDHPVTQVDDDILEDEPPMAASQWRVLSAYPYDDNGSMRGSMRGSFQGGNTGSATVDQSNWRLTLGQPVTLIRPTEDSQRHSHLGDPDYAQQDTPTSVYDSQGSRGSSNRTNVSHSRDIHSLRASEGGATGSNGSKGSNQTGTSHKSVSEHGHLKYPEKSSGGTGDVLLSAFGPGPSRHARGTGGGTTDSAGEPSGDIVSPSPRQRNFWWNTRHNSPEPARTRTPPSAPPASSSTPGIRLVGSSSIADTSGEGPSSAPVQPTRGWPAQGVPLDVTPADGRRPSQSHSFVHRESPLRSHSALHSHSPGPSFAYSHSPSGGGAPEISRPGTSTSHSHSQHTHGTHGAETTMGTMTEATTEDDHEQLHEPMPDMPLSDVEHILRSTSPVLGQQKVTGEEHGRGRIGGGGIAPPNTPEWFPRWQQL